MFKDFIRLIFPHNCPSCDNVLSRAEGAVCDECLLAIEETKFHQSPKSNELYFRFAGKVALAGAAALYFYDKRGRFKRMMQALKYGRKPQVGSFLGEFYGKMLQRDGAFANATHVIPVPLHRKRKAERGYNQSEKIAAGLAKGLGIELNTKALARVGATQTQTRKGKSARWENVKSVFELKQPVSGHVILVDDVITTGATLEACLRVLQAQETPPASIVVIALGMARFG